MFSLSPLFLIVTTVLCGLVAGLFYAWSVSVMPGIARLSDRAFVEAMQAMNRAILNPLFFVSFMGCVLLLPLSVYFVYEKPLPVRFWLVLAAAVVYLVGVLGVTAAGNVPLNEAIDRFSTHDASGEAITTARIRFEATWNFLNHVRTWASIGSFALMVVACTSAPTTN